MEEEKNVLEEVISQPKKVEIDGQKVEQHSLTDMIALDKYLASKKAMKKRSVGLKFAKMEASGSNV